MGHTLADLIKNWLAFTQDQFEDCKTRLLRYGEISRQLLISLWYYIDMNRDEFTRTYELISDFELAYTIPQLEIPTKESFCEPLLVGVMNLTRLYVN